MRVEGGSRREEEGKGQRTSEAGGGRCKEGMIGEGTRCDRGGGRTRVEVGGSRFLHTHVQKAGEIDYTPFV